MARTTISNPSRCHPAGRGNSYWCGVRLRWWTAFAAPIQKRAVGNPPNICGLRCLKDLLELRFFRAVL